MLFNQIVDVILDTTADPTLPKRDDRDLPKCSYRSLRMAATSQNALIALLGWSRPPKNALIALLGWPRPPKMLLLLFTCKERRRWGLKRSIYYKCIQTLAKVIMLHYMQYLTLFAKLVFTVCS